MERPAGAIVPTPPPSFNARFSILSAFSYKFFPIIIDEASSRVMIVVAWNDGRDVSMVDRARINRNSVEIGRRITGGNRFVDETVRLGAADRQAKLRVNDCALIPRVTGDSYKRR